MKKMMLLSTFLVAATCAFAQSPDTLTAYTGTYKFPEGSVVTTAEITVENGVLTVNSSQGASPMERQGRDTFAITNFGGLAYFFRNGEGKVDRVRVEVGSIVLEGTKQAPAALALSPKEMACQRKWQGQPVRVSLPK